MATATAKVTKPSDFVVLKSYTNSENIEVEGEYPIYISGVSLCCTDNTGYVEAIPITIPPQ